MSGKTLTHLGHRSLPALTGDNRFLTVSRVGLVAVCLAFLVLRAAGVSLSLSTQAGIYLFGMVALNLPHGGYEHFANLRRRELDFRWRYLGCYLGLVGAFVALFVVAPVAGLALAIGVAVAKGGFGGLAVLDATSGTDHLPAGWQRALAALVRGGAVMAVPLVAWPGVFQTFSHHMVAIFDPGALLPYTPYFETTRWVVGGGWLAAALAHVGVGFHRGCGRAWLVDAAETALLGVYFVVVPVVVAVGLYFPLWYSTRQVGRDVAIDAERGTGGPDVLDVEDPQRVALAAWGLLMAGAVLTFLLAGLLYRFAPNPLGSASPLVGGVAFWSVFVSIVALPHVVVGGWLDRRQGIWFVP